MAKPKISTAGRTEWIADIALPSAPTNAVVNLPTNGGLIPNDRFMYGLFLQYEARWTNAGANNPSGQMADGPYSLIDTVQVQGFHRIRGAQEQFINARGADLRELAFLYNSRAPLVTPTNGTLVTTASTANDIRFIIPIWFVPMGLPLSQQVDFLLDAPNYDGLKLNIQVADDQNIFTYGTRGAPTVTGFGGVGSPRIRVHGVFAQGGRKQFQGFVPARPWRYFIENTSSDVTSTGTNVRLHNIPRGYRLRSQLVKTGVRATAVASGNAAYQTLSNSILTNLKVMRGLNKQIRFFADYFMAREDAALAYSVTPDTGYALIDFAQHGSWHEALDLTGLAAGPQGDTDVINQSDVTGAASQGALTLLEELRGLPIYG